ncbi:hypothetical protein ACH5RR_041834 [Cinchona calisaya]|uniref:Growth-regulating factor n=1 Tax=Cinchona calisaya TaxID=153742 RepID=A0ABD2XXW0_9GENT
MSMAGDLKRTSRELLSLEYDVGFGLKMQESESSYPSSSCKRNMLFRLQPSPSHQYHPSTNVTACNGSNGSIPMNYQLACGGSDIYGAAVSLAGASAASGGVGMPASAAVCGKSVFTAAQWQEFERQTEICKYMMTSVPVPSQLLSFYYNNPSPALGLGSQSTTSALDLRYSGGKNSEPWRCRRTDGKKWRCSRDVAPDQKYCERHAHKSRPRSRKHVEIQPHNATNYCPKQPNILLANTSSQLRQKPIAHYPTIGSTVSYDHYRGVDWFTKGDSGTTFGNQHWQLPMQSSSTAEENRNSLKPNKEESSFQHNYQDKQDPMISIPYMDRCSAERSKNHQLISPYCNSFLDPKAAFLQGNLDHHTTQTTRHFIDAWSTSEREGLDKIGNKGSMTSGMKLPLSSLTLSIPGGNDIDENNEHANMGFRMMMSSERDSSEEVIKSQWTNPISWMSSTPGGPLGEALCLGVDGSAKLASNLPSPHGYSNSTTTSSCSRSSCEDGTHDLNFIG